MPQLESNGLGAWLWLDPVRRPGGLVSEGQPLSLEALKQLHADASEIIAEQDDDPP